MPKRAADETTEPVTSPQAKRTCRRQPDCILDDQQQSRRMDITPPPEIYEIDLSGSQRNGEGDLITRFEAMQTALVQHLEQKCTRLRFVAPHSAYAAESQLAKVTGIMEILNQEIAAMEPITTQMMRNYDLSSNGLTTCRTGHPTYFAPHQYVPIPQA